MKKIQMVDLQGQYERIRSEVQASFEEVLSTTAFINGPQVQQFQKELEAYMGVKHVIPCANGTDALQIAMMGLGLKEGDEVITADFTFAATVEVIALLKLTPVLVDVYDDTFNINIEAIEKAITPRTKAIVPVHLFGQPANMEAVMALAKKHNLFVIEDNGTIVAAIGNQAAVPVKNTEIYLIPSFAKTGNTKGTTVWSCGGTMDTYFLPISCKQSL